MTDIHSVTAGLVSLVTFMLVLYYGKYVLRRRKMPPGPFPLPILGSCLQLQSEGLLPSLIKMSEKFGPIYTIYMGSRPTVVLTGYQAVKEAQVDLGDAFINQGDVPVLNRLFSHGGLTMSSGESWKQLRQFSILTLKDFGMGKKSLEEPIQAEAQHLVEYFTSLNEQPFDPSTTLTCAYSNVMSNILMGTRYDYTDKKWMKILQDTRHAFYIVSSTWGQLYDMFPNVMQYLPGPARKFFNLLKPLQNVVKEKVRSHQETLDTACPQDYIDCFLIRMKQEEKNPKTPFNLVNLTATVFSMFLGATESTSNTVNCGFLILIKYPELQGKRSCIAESLVHLQLFIFFTVILQKFTLKSTIDPKHLDISATERGLENLPPAHKIIFISRV